MKYCKHGVSRTDSKYVSKHVNKNADMYAYKGVLARVVYGWMGVWASSR